MRNNALNAPLDDKELEQLYDFLDNAGPGVMGLEEVDGFFCALICDAKMMPPSEYLPEILGEEFAFGEQEDAMRVVSLLMRHWNTISRTLQKTLGTKTLTVDDVYLPFMCEDENGVTQGNDWAKGFMRGVKQGAADWHALMESEDHGGAIIPMMILDHEHDPDSTMRPNPITPENRRDLHAAMVAGLINIYRYFEPFRRVEARGFRDASTSRRMAPKIGRNDPCPCGSGKKYKHCCINEVFEPTIH